MRSIIPDYLTEVLGDVESDISGERAGYIPELAAADPERLGAAFAMVDGEVYGAGDIDTEFTIQSISKPFTYALVLSDRGFDAVLGKVGVEPSGEAFNQISLERDTGRPFNPMINVGLHVMEVPAAGRAVVRSNHVVGSGTHAIRVFQLQGGISFAGAERVVRETMETAPAQARVALSPARPVAQRSSRPGREG